MTSLEASSIAELAPAIVVRAARFPLRSLLELADLDFAELAAQNKDERAIGEAYGKSIARQRRTLAKLTIEDPRFGRALSITNEELARRVLGRKLPEVRNKRSRHLETTLYRYLARAVWRTEPCDLWSGVALGTWGERTRVTASAARYAFAPDLRPFQQIVQSLAKTSAYKRTGLYKLNPTLRRHGSAFRYYVRTETKLVAKERPIRAGLDLLLHALEGLPSLSFEDLVAALRRRNDFDPANLEDVLAALVDAGLVVGGLTFPSRFSSAWEALMLASSTLGPEHAGRFRRATRKIRRICRRLERDVERLRPSDLHAAQDAVRAEVLHLASELAVPTPQFPRSILRCDQSLPHTFVFGPDARRALEKASVEYDAFEHANGLDAAIRLRHRTRLLETREKTPPPIRTAVPTQEWAWRVAGEDALLGRRLAWWSRWLETEEPAPASSSAKEDVRLPPIGALLLRPSTQGFTIVGSTPEVVPAYGRYGPLWQGLARSNRAAFPNHPLHVWVDRALRDAAREANVEILEYVCPCEPAPNGLARPSFGFPTWDMWGTGPSVPMREIRVELTEDANAAFVFANGDARRRSVTCFSPLNVGVSDPLVERALLTSFREMPNWIWAGLPFERELRAPRPSPRLALESGNVVRARRTVLLAEDLEQLVKARRERRFVLWQALAKKYQWPPLVLLSRDVGVPLLVVRDSPLALEAALEGIGRGISFLSIEEPDDPAWLVDDAGEAFTAELIVPFLRRRHAWSSLAANEHRARGA